MSSVLRTFEIGLYQEHLEEISFLYEQRLLLWDDPQMPWRQIAEFEARMEAHIDALVVGDALALQVCLERAREGDFGELFAAVCVCCRQDHAGMLADILRGLDVNDPPKVSAVADALKYELPTGWSSFIEQALARRDARLSPLLATVAGYRRLPFGPWLQHAAATESDNVERIITALGRLKEFAAQSLLEQFARNSDASVRNAALHALLRIGASDLDIEAVAPDASAAPAVLALGGNRTSARLLTQAAQAGRGSTSVLLALGLLGDPSAMRLLYESLQNPELADAAALALHWITGAPLAETVFVPEPLKEDELMGKELQAWQQHKEVPKRSDGKPFGESATKLTTEQQHWKHWFSQHASQFNPDLRYRNGKPCSPAVLLENLIEPNSDGRLRRFVAQELVVRYGCDIPFETDMPVMHQIAAIGRITTWVKERADAFQAGRWYLNGRVQ